jgi:hypothetical protein
MDVVWKHRYYARYTITRFVVTRIFLVIAYVVCVPTKSICISLVIAYVVCVPHKVISL